MGKVAAAAIAVLVLAIVPLVAPQQEYALDILFLIFLYGTLSTGWNILGGFAGQVSFGHAAFLGIGAYATTIALGAGWPLPLAILLSGALAAAYSLLVGLPTFRLRGPYFSIATIGIGEATRLIALNWTSLTGGASGLTLSAAPSIAVQYEGALALLVVAVGVTIWMRRSRLGIALDAVRADPDAAETLGVDTTLAKTQALLISATMVGIAGSVYALHYLFVSPDSTFGFSTSIGLVLMPIIGGIGTIAGPLLGAVVYTFIREELAAQLQNVDLLAFGLLLIAIVLFEPAGLLGAYKRLTSRARRKVPAATPRPADG